MPDGLFPAREVFRHLPAYLVVLFYVAAAVAMAVCAWGFWLRVRKYRRGRAAGCTVGLWGRALWAGQQIARHATLRKRNALVGWSHAAIFWGFAALFAGTLIIMIDHDVLRPIIPVLQFWQGTFYLWYSATLDVLGAAFVAGLVVMGVRRWPMNAPALDYARPDRKPEEYDRSGYQLDDRLFLWGLVWIGVTGFAVEALRIAADRPAFETWSVIGWQLANGIDALGIPRSASDAAHPYVWWLHGLLALAFVAYVPYSKAIHMVVDAVSLAVRDPLAGKRLPPALEAGAQGYQTLRDFTWKELLHLDACTRCGRCHVACPAQNAGAPLSPRDLVLELRECADDGLGGGRWLRETRPGRQAANGDGGVVTGTVITAETLWACTTCLACVETCPVGIEHVPLIVQMRRRLVEEGSLDPNLQSALEKIGRYGNSFGQSDRLRGRWTQGLPVKVKDARKEPVELLWWVGDYASYDPGLRDVTRMVAQVFQKAGVDFGILYDGERHAGNDVRRVGEEGLYQVLVEKNLVALRGARFAEIVTTDPHSYNTLRFEYAEFGGAFTVRHYSEVLRDLLASGRLAVRKPLGGVATYHDPCYLSRYTEVTDAPREVLKALGLAFVEMGRHGANSFCCGAGGGRIWMSDTRRAGVATPAEQRIAEALEIDRVRYFVVACPKDLTMFRDAVKTSGQEGRIEVKDLIELVQQAIE